MREGLQFDPVGLGRGNSCVRGLVRLRGGEVGGHAPKPVAGSWAGPMTMRLAKLSLGGAQLLDPTWKGPAQIGAGVDGE